MHSDRFLTAAQLNTGFSIFLSGDERDEDRLEWREREGGRETDRHRERR